MKNILLLLLSIYLLSCGNTDSPTAIIGVEGTNFIKGKILNNDNSAYTNAKVYLLKENSEVTLAKAMTNYIKVDSTISNSEGKYSFKLSLTGMYEIEIFSENDSLLQTIENIQYVGALINLETTILSNKTVASINPIREISIKNTDFGYSHFSTTIIPSLDSLSMFEESMAVFSSWDNSPGIFFDALKNDTIDFLRESIILVRITENLHNIVTLNTPSIGNSSIDISYRVDRTDIGDTTMVYYCFAFVAKKGYIIGTYEEGFTGAVYANPTNLPHSAKGYDLFSWSGNKYKLLTGTNRSKTEEEIYYEETFSNSENNYDDDFINISANNLSIYNVLAQLPKNEEIFWRTSSVLTDVSGDYPTLQYPTDEEVEKLKTYCHEIGVILTVEDQQSEALDFSLKVIESYIYNDTIAFNSYLADTIFSMDNSPSFILSSTKPATGIMEFMGSKVLSTKYTINDYSNSYSYNIYNYEETKALLIEAGASESDYSYFLNSRCYLFLPKIKDNPTSDITLKDDLTIFIVTNQSGSWKIRAISSL